MKDGNVFLETQCTASTSVTSCSHSCNIILLVFGIMEKNNKAGQPQSWPTRTELLCSQNQTTESSDSNDYDDDNAAVVTLIHSRTTTNRSHAVKPTIPSPCVSCSMHSASLADIADSA